MPTVSSPTASSPSSRSNLSLLPDGRVRYELRRRAGPASPAALTLEPTEFLHRLAATVPPPYQHRTVYHGIFAPAANRRFEVSPEAARASRSRHRCAAPSNSPPTSVARSYLLEHNHRPRASSSATTDSSPGPDADLHAQAAARFCAPPRRPAAGRFPWAELIARTFPDALQCPKCGATLSVIAYITELAVVRKILEHLGLPAGFAELEPARLPQELSFDFELHGRCSGGADDALPAAVGGPSGPGPPADHHRL